jgi:hypothetical protein
VISHNNQIIMREEDSKISSQKIDTAPEKKTRENEGIEHRAD